MTQGQGTAIFSPLDVVEIRRQWDNGTISVRKWADTYGCSPETVRKIGRRDTYRTIGADGPAASRDSTSTGGSTAVLSQAAPWTPGQPFPKGDSEPTAEEQAASLSRVMGMVAEAERGKILADEVIAELEKRND